MSPAAPFIKIAMPLKTHADALHYISGLKGQGMRLGLENTARILAHLGNPELKVPTVHIAGTNGKGSTAAFLESILRQAGHRVGLFTTPHLDDFSERVQLGRVPIPADALIEFTRRIRDASAHLGIPLTYFEFGAVLAFLYFHQAGATFNVIEVGLGGRLDATNLCRPEVAIITSIGHDHGEYLGPSLSGIAREKAFIIKENGTVFAHCEDAGAFDEIARRSQAEQAALYRFGDTFNATLRRLSATGQTLDFDWGPHRLQGLETALIGHHQVTNAALATAAALWLAKWRPEIDEAAIRFGLKNARWPGRLEVMAKQPWLVLDAAHNTDGVMKLTQSLRELFPYDRLILVLGILKDKPAGDMLDLFRPLADHVVFTRPDQERAEEPAQLAGRLRQPGEPARNIIIETADTVGQALLLARAAARPGDLVLVTGSIFTVAEARRALAHETEPDTPIPGGPPRLRG